MPAGWSLKLFSFSPPPHPFHRSPLLELVVVALLTRHRTAAGARVESPSHHGIALGSGLLVLALAAALFRVAMLPDPYDSLTYHLMLPAHWLEHQHLDLLPTTFGDIAPTYTPEAVEVFFLGLMLPTGSDILARIGQLPFLLVGLVTLARLVPRTPVPWMPVLAGFPMPETLEGLDPDRLRSILSLLYKPGRLSTPHSSYIQCKSGREMEGEPADQLEELEFRRLLSKFKEELN